MLERKQCSNQQIPTGLIGRHERSNEREMIVFDPPQHLAQLEEKIGSLDQTAPPTG